MARVQEEFGIRVAVRDLFDNQTVMELAHLVDRDDNRATTPAPVLDLEAEADNHDLKDAV